MVSPVDLEGLLEKLLFKGKTKEYPLLLPSPDTAFQVVLIRGLE